MPRTQVHESYYGIGEIRGNTTRLVCLLEPGAPRPGLPRSFLEFDVVVPVEGYMVVGTIRHQEAEGFDDIIWQGSPEMVIRVSYDPDPNPPGRWRGEMKGEWPARLIPIVRPTIWTRILNDPLG